MGQGVKDFPGACRAWLLTGIFAVLQGSGRDGREEEEGLCLIQEVTEGLGDPCFSSGMWQC